MSISNKAVIVRLHQGKVPFSVIDKEITRETNVRMGITDGMSRFTKAIFSKRAIQCVVVPYGEQYRYHCSMTLPFGDKGSRIISSKGFIPYTQKMRALEKACMDGAEEFIRNRQANIDEARDLLTNPITGNSAFKIEDYPTEEEMRKSFKIVLKVEPIPDGGNLILDGIVADELKEYQDSCTENTKNAIQAAMSDAWKRIYDVTRKVAETLNQDGKTFRDSLIGNVRELVDALPVLNVTDDPELEKARAMLAENVASVYPEDLRGKSPSRQAYRKEIAEVADELAKKASFYLEPAADVSSMDRNIATDLVVNEAMFNRLVS